MAQAREERGERADNREGIGRGRRKSRGYVGEDKD
jgi:hypothetical protein